MRSRFLTKSLFCLCFAALSAAGWNLHVLGTHHEAGMACHVCAVAAAPELNSDCGSDLISRPDNFTLLKPEAGQLTAYNLSAPAFYGRAPPAA